MIAHTYILYITSYSGLSLIRTPRDRQNLYSLSGVRINRVRIYEVLLYVYLRLFKSRFHDDEKYLIPNFLLIFGSPLVGYISCRIQ